MLSSNNKLYEHFFENKYKLTAPISKSALSNRFYYLIPHEVPYEQALHDCEQYFNIRHAIDFIKMHYNYYDMYCFGGQGKGNEIINFYLNNINILENFSFYSKEKAQPIIKMASEFQFILPREMHTTFGGVKFKKINRQGYVKNGARKGSPKEIFFLTLREQQYLQYLKLGYTYKDIAKKLGLSNRTVEQYLTNIKSKISCERKSEIIEKINKITIKKFSDGFYKN